MEMARDAEIILYYDYPQPQTTFAIAASEKGSFSRIS